jgi:hypothetical protein
MALRYLLIYALSYKPVDDDSYDRVNGTDTSGIVPTRNLDIADDYTPPVMVVDLYDAYQSVPDATKCPGFYNNAPASPGLPFHADRVHQGADGYEFMADEVVSQMRAYPTSMSLPRHNDSLPTAPGISTRGSVVLVTALILGAYRYPGRRNRP